VKSKVKYAVLVLVIGLLGLAILASPVFGGGKTTYLYEITVKIDKKLITTFVAAGNKGGTKIAGDGVFQQGMVKVEEMNFPPSVVDQLDPAEDEDSSFNKYPDPRPLYWSPLEDLYGDYFDFKGIKDDDHLQDLNSNDYNEWKYHSGGLDYRKNTLSFRFDMFYIYDDGEGREAHDHYILGIEMEFTKDGDTYTSIGDATLNWTHYTEPIKPRGKNLQVDFQHLKCTCYCPVTITIEPLQ
jgi:hypothetical protein